MTQDILRENFFLVSEMNSTAKKGSVMIIYILRLTFFLFLSGVSVGLYQTTAKLNAEMKTAKVMMKMEAIHLDEIADSYLGFSTNKK
jgi:hypothetical protein